MRKIRLGVVGANVHRGWASRSHMPAIAALDDYELIAVATTRQDSADEAARKFNASRAYDSAERLIQDRDIEAVAVVVRVDRHLEPVMSALHAGKHVFCEWPLGNSTREAEEMTALAVRMRTIHQVGFQTRRNAVVRHMKGLIDGGYLGRLRSVTMSATVTRWGAVIPAETIYGADARIGVNVVNIQGGHSFDLLCYLLGDFVEVGANIASLRQETQVAETGELIPFTAPDQLVVNGVLAGGAVVAAHLQSGALQAPGFQMHVRGEEGELLLSSPDVVPTGTLRLAGGRRGDNGMMDLAEPASEEGADPRTAALPQVVASVAASYRAFASSILSGEDASPSFEDALGRHRLLDTFAKAAFHSRAVASEPSARHSRPSTFRDAKSVADLSAGGRL